jgi:O-antigen/teichoic acid export membrane protein
MSKIDHTKANIIQRIRSLFSDNTLTKKASLNALAAGLEYAAKLIVGFVVTPIMVAGLGDYFYGAYQVLSRLIGYLTPTSGRPTQALKMKLANKQLVANDEEKRRYVGSTLVILLLFLPLTVIAGTVLTWFSPIWLKAEVESYGVIRLAAGLLSFALILQNLISIPRSALEGENLGYKRMGLSVFLVLFSGGLTWLAIALKTGIAGVAAAALISSVITGVFYFLVVRVYAPWFGIKKASRADNREFLGLSVWFMLWNLINILMMASDVVILGLFNSVQSVTNYTLTKYAPETTINVIAIAVFSILPGLGGIIGSGDLTRAAKVRSEIMSFTWWILTVFGATIILWNEEFLGLWVGSSHYPGGFTNLLIILMVSQFVIMRNDANVIDLTLKLKQKVTLGMISVVLAIGLSIFFLSVLKMGIPGLVLGTMTGRLVLSLAYPLMVGKMISLPWGQQLKSIIRPLIVTILLFIGLMFAGEKFESFASALASSWIGLILSVGMTFVLVLLITYYVGFNKSQKEIVIRRLRAIFFTGNRSGNG